MYTRTLHFPFPLVTYIKSTYKTWDNKLYRGGEEGTVQNNFKNYYYFYTQYKNRTLILLLYTVFIHISYVFQKG